MIKLSVLILRNTKATYTLEYTSRHYIHKLVYDKQFLCYGLLPAGSTGFREAFELLLAHGGKGG